MAGGVTIGTQVVTGLKLKFVDESLALNEPCADTKFHVYCMCPLGHIQHMAGTERFFVKKIT